ncbi:sodium/calcium exchanger NCL1-like protein, partial [Tanacetum coccineum]
VGVKIDNDTCNMASILLLSLIPFAVVLLLLVFNNRIIVLIALIVSVLSFCYYIRYQIKHPRIQAKSVTFLKEEEFQKKFLLKLKGPKNESIYTNKGHPDTEVIKSIFKSRDADNDGYLKRSELENFIRDTFDNEEEHIFRQYALDEILRHFDKDSTQSLTMTEFEEGCTSWLNKWSVANKGLERSREDPQTQKLQTLPMAGDKRKAKQDKAKLSQLVLKQDNEALLPLGLPVEGRGECALPSGAIIKDVLHVPKFKCNLLSVSRLSKELQCAVTFFPEFCIMQDLYSHDH